MLACLIPMCLKPVYSKQTGSGDLAQPGGESFGNAIPTRGHALLSCTPISVQETLACMVQEADQATLPALQTLPSCRCRPA